MTHKNEACLFSCVLMLAYCNKIAIAEYSACARGSKAGGFIYLFIYFGSTEAFQGSLGSVHISSMSLASADPKPTELATLAHRCIRPFELHIPRLLIHYVYTHTQHITHMQSHQHARSYQRITIHVCISMCSRVHCIKKTQQHTGRVS